MEEEVVVVVAVKSTIFRRSHMTCLIGMMVGISVETYLNHDVFGTNHSAMDTHRSHCSGCSRVSSAGRGLPIAASLVAT